MFWRNPGEQFLIAIKKPGQSLELLKINLEGHREVFDEIIGARHEVNSIYSYGSPYEEADTLFMAIDEFGAVKEGVPFNFNHRLLGPIKGVAIFLKANGKTKSLTPQDVFIIESQITDYELNPYRSNPENPAEDFEEIAEELLELNHPFARDLARDEGLVYAMLREDPWFFNRLVQELMQEFETPEEAAEELELI
jgi:hypothetical protein